MIFSIKSCRTNGQTYTRICGTGLLSQPEEGVKVCAIAGQIRIIGFKPADTGIKVKDTRRVQFCFQRFIKFPAHPFFPGMTVKINGHLTRLRQWFPGSGLTNFKTGDMMTVGSR